LRLQRSQWKRRDQLAEAQGRRLRELVNHAYRNVPFYHELFREAGVDPDSITGAASIRKLPILTKERVRSTPLKQRTAAGFDESCCMPRSTSGSTGIPITVLEEPRAKSHRAALHLRRLWAYGMRPTHTLCNAIPNVNAGGLTFGGAGLWGSVVRRKIKTLVLTGDLNEQIDLIFKWKPDVIIAAPSYFRDLASLIEEKGRRISFKVALPTGEMLDPPTRKLIGDTFHSEVYDFYGATELGGVAWECPTHNGYHINYESFVVECVRDGEPVAEGEPGDLCISNLYRKATPMIRYLIGDAATLVDDDCPCGRGLPLVKDIQGRVVDFIKTPDGGSISPYMIMFVLESVSGLAQYKVIQRSDYSIELLVRIVDCEVEPVLQSLRQHCKQLFGNMPHEIRIVGRIETSTAQKYRVVESDLA